MKTRKIIFILPAVLVIVAALCLTSPPPAKRHLLNGLRLEQAGMPAQAEDEYILATRADPAMGQAWLGLARVLAQTGRFRPAEHAWLKAIGLPHDGQEEALLGLGWILLEESRMADLEKLAQHARTLGKPNVARELRAWRLVANVEEKVLAVGRVLSYDSRTRLDATGLAGLRARINDLPENAPGRNNAGRLLSEAEKLALEALDEAAPIENPRGKLLQAKLHRMIGNTAKADEIAEKLAHTRDGRVSAVASLMLARAAKESGRVEPALEHVSDALRADPANAAARLELKSLRLAMRSFQSAMLDISLGTGTAPSAEAEAQYNNGLFDILRRDHARAIVTLGKVVRQHPQWTQARMALATAYYRSESKAQALVQFTIIAKQEPLLISPHLAIARILLDTGSMHEAIAHANRVLALEPANPQALEILAEGLIKSDSLAKGLAAFNKRIESGRIRDPSLQQMLRAFQDAVDKNATLFNVNALGMIHLARGEAADAERQIKRLRAISPTAPIADYQLAQLHEHNGDYAKAASVLRAAIEIQQLILENKYADAYGLKDDTEPSGRILLHKREKLTPEQRDMALRSTPLLADLHAKLGAIVLKANDYDAALDHSSKALGHDGANLEAAIQIAAARRAKAANSLAGVPDALEQLAETVGNLGARQLKSKHAKLLEKQERQDKRRQRLLDKLKTPPEIPDELSKVAEAFDGARESLDRHQKLATQQTSLMKECEKILKKPELSAIQRHELRQKLQQAGEIRDDLADLLTKLDDLPRQRLREKRDKLQDKQETTKEERDELAGIIAALDTLRNWKSLAGTRRELLAEQERSADDRDELAAPTAAIDALTRGTFEARRNELRNKQQQLHEDCEKLSTKPALSDEEKQELLQKRLILADVRNERLLLTQTLIEALTECGKYAMSHAAGKPADVREPGPTLSGLRAALQRTREADDEFAAGADVLRRMLVSDPENVLLLSAAAELYDERSAATKLAQGAYQILVAKTTTVHKEAKARRTALVQRQQRDRLVDDVEEQIGDLLDVLIPLQAQLAKLRNHTRRDADRADQYRQKARE
ncbi:MAG: tetratricopeptide repeat protein, partial [Planctomycetes bacterium]|nr:tetratricopeptide repeat protein [Planctomycetota bacterium]